MIPIGRVLLVLLKQANIKIERRRRLSPNNFLSPASGNNILGNPSNNNSQGNISAAGGNAAGNVPPEATKPSSSIVTATSLSGEYLRIKVCLLSDGTPIVCQVGLFQLLIILIYIYQT